MYSRRYYALEIRLPGVLSVAVAAPYKCDVTTWFGTLTAIGGPASNSTFVEFTDTVTGSNLPAHTNLLNDFSIQGHCSTPPWAIYLHARNVVSQYPAAVLGILAIATFGFRFRHVRRQVCVAGAHPNFYIAGTDSLIQKRLRQDC